MKFLRPLLGLIALSFVAVNAFAAETIVLCDSMSTELKGESKAPGATGCVDLSSWGWGESLTTSVSGGGGGGGGKANLSDFTLQKFVDSSTVTFATFLQKATPFKGTLQFRAYIDCAGACSTPTPFFTIDMTRVFVASQSVGGSGDGRPTESISLAYDTIKVCYRTTDPDTGMLGTPLCQSYSVATSQPIP